MSNDSIPAPQQPTPEDQRLVSPRWLLSANVKPLPPPELPADLPDMPPVVRESACAGWYARTVEHGISPGGQLRALLQLLCRVCVVVGALALTTAAVLMCVAMVLGFVVIITGQCVAILTNLVYAALLVLALLVVCMVVLLAVRLFLRTL